MSAILSLCCDRPPERQPPALAASGAHKKMRGYSLTRQTAWLMLAKTLSFCLTVAVPLLVVRRLSQFEFGLYKQCFLAINTAVNVLPLGFGMTAYYFLPRCRDRQGTVVFHIVLFSLTAGLLASLALTLDPGLLVILFKEAALTAYAPLIASIIPLWILALFLEVVTVANQEVRLASIFIVATQLSRTALFVSATLFFGSVRALLWAALIQTLLQVSCVLFYVHSRFPGFWGGPDWSLLRAQLAYGLPLGYAGLLYTIQTDLHNYFVSHKFGADLFAVYSIGCFQLPLMGLLAESASSVMIARVSELQRLDHRGEIIAVTARAMRKLAAVFFPAYAFLMVVAGEFIAFLFTPRYLAARPIFMINLTLLPAGTLFIDPVIRAYSEHLYFLAKLRTGLFVILFAALWAATNRFGMIGAVTVAVGMTLLERVITVAYFGRILGFSARDFGRFRDTGKLALASAVAALAAWLVKRLLADTTPLWILLASGVTLALTYLAAILVLGVATAEERGTAWRTILPFVPSGLRNSLAKVFS